ncbi:hypothetical protein TCAL_14389 [Tigriopus californicus]|uniref:AB hydrolase-1 domain-containing protein n=2 Tax=Tigriopus californicus TaxID=6832 RepID=A0A553PJG6_TIGCA|nr:hypothetical protein TCAL_14389 [Tigriopus californicus]
MIQAKAGITGQSKPSIILNNAYFILMAVIFLEIAASWDVYGRGDVGLWSMSIIVMCILNVYCLSTSGPSPPPSKKKNRVIHPISEQSRLISDSSDDLDILYDGRRSNSDGWGCCGWVLFYFNCGLKLLVLVFACLLMKGAIAHGMGIQHHAPKEGEFLDLPLGPATYPDTQSIYYRCEGNSTEYPTLILEHDISHGMVEWLGIFPLLVQDGFRVCIWDKPGTGFSEYAFRHQFRPKYYYSKFIQALAEEEPDFQGPYVFIGGSTGGGQIVLQLAQANPSLVSSVILLDALTPNFSLKSLVTLKNVTETQRDLIWHQAIDTNRKLLGIFNSVAVPFGLMSSFVPQKPTNNKYWSLDDRMEQRWQSITEKTWIIKYWEPSFSAKNLNSSLPIDPRIPVHVIMSALSDAQIERHVCRDNRDFEDNLSESDCHFKKAQNKLAIMEKRSLAQNGGRIVECTQDYCGLDYFIYEDPAYTLNLIRQLILNEPI